ncbi:MAG: hypothetical protein PHT12_00515 [Patescibacteria group bacterium]|nr:hypothetical protein [Patescibacteria group bacterium]
MSINKGLWNLQRELLAAIAEHGVRVSHRSHGLKFDEGNATLLLDKVKDELSGIAVGDDVTVDWQRVRPFEFSDALGAWEVGGRANAAVPQRRLRVIAFFRVTGRVRSCTVQHEGTYCALLDWDNRPEQPDFCRGQEFYHPESKRKINLYWIGALVPAEQATTP